MVIMFKPTNEKDSFLGLQHGAMEAHVFIVIDLYMYTYIYTTIEEFEIDEDYNRAHIEIHACICDCIMQSQLFLIADMSNVLFTRLCDTVEGFHSKILALESAQELFKSSGPWG